MIVTKYKFYLQDSMIRKLDSMAERCTNKKKKRDAFLINEGAEGEGKTTLSIAQGFYLADKMKRNFSEKNIFFKIDNLIEYAQSTENKIIIWDEPALESLGDDSRGKTVRDLFRLLMMARKKRHFIIVNITYFTKFNDYIIVDRPLGMFKVYSRKNNNEARFSYIPKKNLGRLWDDWKKKKRKNYFKYASKVCRGTFPDVLSESYKGNILKGFDVDKYEQNKDDAIMSIGNAKKDKKSQRILEFKYLISTLKGITQKEKAVHFRISQPTISDWGKLIENNRDLLRKIGEKSVISID